MDEQDNSRETMGGLAKECMKARAGEHEGGKREGGRGHEGGER